MNEEVLNLSKQMKAGLKQNLQQINEILSLKKEINQEQIEAILHSIVDSKEKIDTMEKLYLERLGENFGEDYEFNELYRDFLTVQKRIIRRIIDKKKIRKVLGLQQEDNEEPDWITSKDDVYSVEKALKNEMAKGKSYEELMSQILQKAFSMEDKKEFLQEMKKKKEKDGILTVYKEMYLNEKKSTIMDYDDVNNKLDNILENQNKSNPHRVIREEVAIGTSSIEHLPIRHFSVGNGKKHIVYTASMHGNQIISTEFVLKTMEELRNGTADEETLRLLDKGEITIDFVPVFNPEGYIVTTSAIRALIDKEMPAKEAEKISKDYYLAVRGDNVAKSESKHMAQEMFKHVDYTVISAKYPILREKVKERQAKANMPPWTLQFTSSNGNGVDLNEDTDNNGTRKKLRENAEAKIYNGLGYINNIPKSEPSSIGYPGEEGTTQLENKAFENFLQNLQKNRQVIGMFNLGATGGQVYYNPSPDWNLPKEWIEYNQLTVKMLVDIMQNENPENVYKINDDDRCECRNDYYRSIVPGDYYIALSKMGGNPIAPYGDLANHERVMKLTKVLEKQISRMYEVYKTKGIGKQDQTYGDNEGNR